MLKYKLLLSAARAYIYGELMSNTNNPVTQISFNMGNGEAIVGVETALMRSITMGTVAEVRQELAAQPNLSARDRDERTPWLLSIYTGDIEKAKILWTAAIDPTDQGKYGKTALMLLSPEVYLFGDQSNLSN
jgi:ankyrin repeat protein